MSKREYFLWAFSEDGDAPTVTHCTREEVLKELKGDPGEISYFDRVLDGLPERGFDYVGGKFLIIKGHIVVPKPVKVVKEYELE